MSGKSPHLLNFSVFFKAHIWHWRLETHICFQKAEQTSTELIFRREVGRNPLSKKEIQLRTRTHVFEESTQR